MKKTKFIFITGGVISGLGKGIISASLGKLLKSRGYRIDLLKLDPYLNLDAGTMSPAEHGEVFVTKDGAETDLDIGNYERFTGLTLTSNNNITAGRIYKAVMEKERKGESDGKTVQIIPHITDEIKSHFYSRDGHFDFVLVEIGGTVGDIESLPFIEAVRQYQKENKHTCLNAHVTYIPYIPCSGEQKTKPTQNSIKELRSLGISPTLLLCRSSENWIEEDSMNKLSTFCDLSPETTFLCPDTDIYNVPTLLEEQGIVSTLEELFNLQNTPSDETNKELEGFTIAEDVNYPIRTIAIATKYSNKEAHTSLLQMIRHCSYSNGFKPNIKFIECGANKSLVSDLVGVDAVVLSGGFGSRGVEDKIAISRYCRANDVPLFGICLGMQAICIGALRDSDKIDYFIDSQECSKQDTHRAAIILMEEQKDVTNRGGTLKIGEHYQLVAHESMSLTFEAYENSKSSLDRYRHRYQVNPIFEYILKEEGFSVTGRDTNGLITIIESTSPLIIGTQFHPEFISRMELPHPLFNKFCSLVIKNESNSSCKSSK